MAITLLFTSPLTRPRIGSLQIDAVISETHEGPSAVTEEVVDVDSILTDHIINLPERVTINGMVTSTPLRGGLNLNAASAFDTLFELRNKRSTVTVVTSYKVYTNMIITNLTIPRDAATGEAVVFTAQLTKIQRLGTPLQALTAFLEDELAAQISGSISLGRVSGSFAGESASNAASNVIGRLF